MKVKRGARAVEKDGLRAIERPLAAGPPADEYRELATALRHARAAARQLGHNLGHWKRRPYAPNTAATAFCTHCSAAAVVNLDNGPDATGPAPGNPARPSARQPDLRSRPRTRLQYVPQGQLMKVTIEHSRPGGPFRPLTAPGSTDTSHNVRSPHGDCTELVRDLIKYVTLRPGDQLRIRPVIEPERSA